MPASVKKGGGGRDARRAHLLGVGEDEACDASLDGQARRALAEDDQQGGRKGHGRTHSLQTNSEPPVRGFLEGTSLEEPQHDRKNPPFYGNGWPCFASSLVNHNIVRREGRGVITGAGWNKILNPPPSPQTKKKKPHVPV